MDSQLTDNMIDALLVNDPSLQEKWLLAFAASLAHHIHAVQVAGRLLEIEEGQLLAHDLSKWDFAEFPHYARAFHGDKGDPDGFAAAWLHHQNHNPHHWEYWVSRSGRINGPLPMPGMYVRELVADWQGASRVYTGSWLIDGWCSVNIPKFWLHPQTQDRVGGVLMSLGYSVSCDPSTNEFVVRQTPAVRKHIDELEERFRGS